MSALIRQIKLDLELASPRALPVCWVCTAPVSRADFTPLTPGPAHKAAVHGQITAGSSDLALHDLVIDFLDVLV